MKITPRQYQIECVESIWEYFRTQSGNPVVAMPTGTGKAVCLAMFMQSVFEKYPNQKILCVTHVKELIRQNYDKLKLLWPDAPAGINSSGLKRRDKHHNIIFAGVGSIVKHWQDFGRVDLLLIDEAHLVSPNDETMYQKLIANLKSVNPYLKVVGFTATPWRLGQGQITEDGIFTDICFDITSLEAFNRLIEEGFLAKLVPKKTSLEIDTDDFHIRAGEFVQSEIELAVDTETVTNAALLEMIECGADRKHWLIFAISIEHAQHIQAALIALGVDCTIVHSKMSDAERDKNIADFKAGMYRAAVNVGVLTTGFDFPEIDLIGCLRPTASVVLWIQLLGRGTRPAIGKADCLVLDFAGNTGRLGPINDPVIPRKKGQKGGEAPVKVCEMCHTYNHTSVRFCSHCGAEFKFEVKIKQKASTKELVKDNMPVVEIFKVDHVTYQFNEKIGKPPSLKVTYYCGLRSFNDFVCIQHDGWAHRKAKEWWHERSADPMPETVKEALQQSDALLTPTHLRVWVNKHPYPEIMAFCYDGTAFGRENISNAA